MQILSHSSPDKGFFGGLCFTDTQNTTILKGKRHLVTESEYLTGKKALSYLLALLKMIK